MSFNTYNFAYSSSVDDTQEGIFPTHTDCNKTITITDGAAWAVIMREFANFLSGVYGYNISEKILIEEWDGDHSRLDDYGV